jgi:hypothetical protein
LSATRELKKEEAIWKDKAIKITAMKQALEPANFSGEIWQKISL